MPGNFVSKLEKDYDPDFEFTLSHDAQSRTMLDSIASNPEKFICWEGCGNLIRGSVCELIKIDTAIKFENRKKSRIPKAECA